jgi:hydrogenase maturation factor
MNLVYAEIVDVEVEDGMRVGSVSVSGAMKRVPLDLIQDVMKGDKVLLCDGVAIAKTHDSRMTNCENHVLGDSR